jgi:hypothetical protein
MFGKLADMVPDMPDMPDMPEMRMPDLPGADLIRKEVKSYCS